MQQSSVCFSEMMQFHQRCLCPTVLQNKLVVTRMTHLMLGWRALMKSVLSNLMHTGKDPQAHGYRCSFPRECSMVSISTGT
jgi:hypothetical protein